MPGKKLEAARVKVSVGSEPTAEDTRAMELPCPANVPKEASRWNSAAACCCALLCSLSARAGEYPPPDARRSMVPAMLVPLRSGMPAEMLAPDPSRAKPSGACCGARGHQAHTTPGWTAAELRDLDAGEKYISHLRNVHASSRYGPAAELNLSAGHQRPLRVSALSFVATQQPRMPEVAVAGESE